jgi:peroxiredoxin
MLSRIALGLALAGAFGGCAPAAPSSLQPREPVITPVLVANDGRPSLGPPVRPAEPRYDGPGWLGVSLAERRPDEPGVVVSSVLRRSPAALHGLQVGDILLGVNDARVQTPEEFSQLIAAVGAGGRANLMLQRQNEPRLLAVQLGENPGFEGQLRLGFLDAEAPELQGVAVALGDVAPSLQALRGRVVVLEFWATWCSACRALMPTLNGWYERYQAQGALVVSVTTDPVGQAAQAASELGLRYPVLSDPEGATAQTYQAFAVPTLFVIDRAGIVRDVSVGYDPERIGAVQATLERLISEI